MSISVNYHNNCAIYIRVSTDKQVNLGYGLDYQEKYCMELIESRGWKAYKVYIDKAVSGNSSPIDRPGYNELIKDCRNKLFTKVVFYSLDRIGRTINGILETLDYLVLMNVKVVSCRESIDSTTPRGKFVLTVLSAAYKLDRRNIIQKMKEGAERRRIKDGEVGGILPYGYQRTSNGIEINMGKAKIIKYVFRQRLKGCKLHDIADKINEAGIKSPGGKKWSKSIISVLLSKQDIYLGGSRNGSDFCWLPILPDEYRNHIFHKNIKSRKTKKTNIEQTHNFQYNHVKENIKCAIYVRVSTSGQANEGSGIETQLTHCENMAKVNIG